jgi:hypothetical protein
MLHVADAAQFLTSSALFVVGRFIGGSNLAICSSIPQRTTENGDHAHAYCTSILRTKDVLLFCFFCFTLLLAKLRTQTPFHSFFHISLHSIDIEEERSKEENTAQSSAKHCLFESAKTREISKRCASKYLEKCIIPQYQLHRSGHRRQRPSRIVRIASYSHMIVFPTFALVVELIPYYERLMGMNCATPTDFNFSFR